MNKPATALKYKMHFKGYSIENKNKWSQVNSMNQFAKDRKSVV